MKYLLLLLCTSVLSTPLLHGQYLRGSIVDKRQGAIPYATIYITELQQGVVANAVAGAITKK